MTEELQAIKSNKPLVPTVQYPKNNAYAPKDHNSRVIEVGFYEKVRKNKYGEVLTHIIIPVPTAEEFKKIPYEGKTLMILIRNSQYTTIHREAKEEDKIKYKVAYQAFLDFKKEQEEPVKRKYERKAQTFKDESSPKFFEFTEIENPESLVE